MKNFSKLNKILVGTFAAQLLLTGIIYIGSQPPAADSVQTALLTADEANIDRITIEDKDGKKTVISKVKQKWQLPGYHQLPANSTKVKEALNKLATTKSGWPIATTDSSHDRFEVDDKKYKTRITLAKGDNVLEKIYLGTSPGFRQIHVRKDNDSEVYSVKLNDYDYPASSESWLDRSLLSADNNIASLSGPDFELTRQGDEWKTSGDKVGVVKDKANELVTALTTMNVNKAVDTKLDKTDYQIKVKTTGDKEYDFSFYKKGDKYYVKRNDYDLAFEMNKFDYDKIAGKTAVQLVKQVTEEKSDTVAGNQHHKKPGDNS